MYGKIIVKSEIEVLTGLHIGASNVFSAIGAVDSPVIRDPVTRQPIIPGSSLKGKLRTLLVRSLSGTLSPNGVNDDPPEVKRLFGSAEKTVKTRLQFADAFRNHRNDERLKESGLTEVKFENTINRMTGEANPRQIERVVRGTVFDLTLTYDIEKENEVDEDFKNLASAFRLLTMDYLGGHGTRGYGRVKFSNFSVKGLEGSISSEQEAALTAILKEVESYELLPGTAAV